MAQVTIKINGYAYNVGCKDGEEQHLLAMADQIEQRVERVKALGSQSGESRLLVMAALVMADELHDMALEMRAGQKGTSVEAERAAQERLQALAARAETIAASAEQE
ncbi:MAG: cell division protein ZapA [Janthinobacterium lividum]